MFEKSWERVRNKFTFSSFLAKKIIYYKKFNYLIGSSIVVLTITSAGFLIGKKLILNKNSSIRNKSNELDLKTKISYEIELKKNLINKPPKYIESQKIENLLTLPRFQNALLLIKLTNLKPNKQTFEKCIEELEKLSNYNNSHETNYQDSNYLEELIKNKLLKNKFKSNVNPFLNDGLADYICQNINCELAIQLAFRGKNVDNRFFRREPPSTRQKLKYLKSSLDRSKSSSIYEDPDYAILFEFYNNFCEKSLSKDILDLINKFKNEMNNLIVSEYFIKQRPKQNIWSSSESDYLLDDMDEETFDDLISDTNLKANSLKQKKKLEFISKNERLIMNIIEKMVHISLDKFIQLGGLELMLLIFEKQKLNESFLVSIGNCLSLISTKAEYRRLFVESGWLKRLNQMCYPDLNSKQQEYQNIQLVQELIAHKVLFNLNQSNKIDSLLFSSMIYPLYPLYSELLDQTKHILDYDLDKVNNHQHVLDIVFIHGLRGSLFKTWRQDDFISIKNNKTKFFKKSTDKYTYCWPKDWLPLDLINNYEQNEKYRILGVNYDSVFSLWGQDSIDDKKLKLTIKQRALDLVDQLNLAHINKRPIVWVCHSMGGLIVKQLLVYLDEQSNGEENMILKNTKAIIFLSTPHLGSFIAKTASRFSFATNPPPDVLELSTHSTYLIELNKKFLKTINSMKELRVLSLCENSPTYIGFNLYAKTVTESSANIGIGEFYLVENKDHLNICKPISRECFVYLKIFDLLNQLSKMQFTKCNKCKIDLNANEIRIAIEDLFEILKINYFY